MSLKYKLPALDMKKTVFWNMAGSVCNAANTILMTMVITRICGAAIAGIYTLALAVAEMLGPISTFQVRNYQASDVKRVFNFHEYLYSRFISILLTLFICIGWIFIHGYSNDKALLILLCTVFKFLEAYEDVYYGQLQVNNRLDIVGRVFALRVVFATIIFIVLLAFTKNIFISYSVYIVFSIVWTLLITLPYANNFICKDVTRLHNILKLLKECLPLCITQFLLAYIISCPKYALDNFYSSEIQTYFTTIFMPASIVNLFTLIIYRLYITKMADDWNSGNISAFLKYTERIVLITFFIGILATIVGWFIGLPILAWFYGLPEIMNYKVALIIILIGGTFNALTGWFNTVFTIIRKQQIILYINLFAFVISLLIINPLAKQFRMNGAAFGYALIMFILSFIQTLTFIYFIFSQQKKQKSK